MTDKLDDNILVLNNVTKRFGGLVAVDDVSLSIKRGEIFALIGPNGAGKTTLFNNVTGLFKPTSGHVILNGKDITGSKPHEVARLGIARTFQNIRLFDYMTCLDNVRVGRHVRMHSKLWDGLFKLPAERREEARVTEEAMELLLERPRADQQRLGLRAARWVAGDDVGEVDQAAGQLQPQVRLVGPLPDELVL